MSKDLIDNYCSLQVQLNLHGSLHFLQKLSLHGKGLYKYLKPSMKYIWTLGQYTSIVMNCNTINLAQYRDR